VLLSETAPCANGSVPSPKLPRVRTWARPKGQGIRRTGPGNPQLSHPIRKLPRQRCAAPTATASWHTSTQPTAAFNRPSDGTASRVSTVNAVSNIATARASW